MSFRYPVALNLQEKKCTVVGGGQVGERKARALKAAGAIVWLIAPRVTAELAQWADRGEISWVKEEYQPTLLQNSFLVIAATSDTKVNREIAGYCSRCGILVEVAGEGEAGSFISNACLQRGDLQITVSTNGKSPALAKKIVADLKDQYGPAYAQVVEVLGEARLIAKKNISARQEREQRLIQLVREGIIELVLAGQVEEARERVRICLS